MKKLIISLLLAASAGLAFAQNSVQYCTQLGMLAYNAAHAKKQGVPKEDFDAAIKSIEADPEIDPHLKREGIKALKYGYNAPISRPSEQTAVEVYDACRATKV